MEFESKILSKNISELLYNSEKTLGTAESCTGGRIAEAIISVPGASNYFKGGVVSYTNEVKENILKVSHEVLEEQTAVCEEVAREMVLGAIDALKVDFAISATGVAGRYRRYSRDSCWYHLDWLWQQGRCAYPQAYRGFWSRHQSRNCHQHSPQVYVRLPQGVRRRLEE